MSQTLRGRTAPKPPALTEHHVRALVALEWQFINADVMVGELIESLTHLGLPEAERATEEMQTIRLKLRHVLNRLDAPITAAVERYETLAIAPF